MMEQKTVTKPIDEGGFEDDEDNLKPDEAVDLLDDMDIDKLKLEIKACRQKIGSLKLDLELKDQLIIKLKKQITELKTKTICLDEHG